MVVLLPAPASDVPRRLDGFSAEAAAPHRTWEEKFRAIPDRDNLRAYMQRLSARPHHLGSPYDKEVAEWILGRFQEWGLEARIETFNVLFPTPTERAVELLAPRRFTAKLQEPAVDGDDTSGQHDEQLPTYNAYSADGDVTAPLVYVNHGVPADYEQLERLGVSVKGAIVIARYGGSWRGIKPKVAAEQGAVGCLIYSDPRDDGYFQGEVFPKGPFRPRDGVQRGSVMDMPLYPGDPLTPGIGATADAKRLDRKDAKTITRIPVLPISYGDAEPLLAALEGPVAPEPWRGSLPITYRIGPGPARVRLKVTSSWDLKPAYNVIARVPGAGRPDEWVVRGNHHDAWVNGADDPVAGQIALLEEARALGELLKQGWKPRRTIIYCAWGAEEQGLLGSTEWGETHAAELKNKTVAYINTDSNGRGFLSAGGSHTLEKFINDVARDIIDPETKLTVWKRAQLARIARSPGERQELRSRPDFRIGALGSGSDYTVFVDHLGIPALNLSFGGLDGGGIYHSIYDDYYWYSRFSDTDFSYGRALAQTVGTAVMRLASAELLPYDFTNFADTIEKYVDELQKLLAGKRNEVEERNRQIEEGVYEAIADPRKTFIPPPVEAVPPHLNFAPLENAVEALTQAAERYDQARSKASLKAVDAINRKLIQSERLLTDPAGLPDRPWYKHQIYAPGYYTGYGVKTIPAVREAIEQNKWQLAEASIARVGALLNAHAALVQSAAEDLEKLAR
ncbi:MAG: M28 family peptidase [Bryobacteraceae bacterium]|nr:M28 family peptidase [Bryobacteraceae bacterium]